MHPWHPRVVSVDDAPPAAEWPVAVWQRLLIGSQIPFGGRVLVIGCRHPEVVGILDEFAFDVDSVDDQPTTVEAANRLFPRLHFTFQRLDEPLPADAHEFDLVLVQDAAAYTGDLVDLQIRLVTANLLTYLKPHGQLIVIRRLTGDCDATAGHSPACWIKHLACFPGITETTCLSDSWLSKSTWNWLFHGQPRGAHLLVRHETPLELHNRDAWLRCARRGQMPGRSACCSAVATPQTLPMRRAA